LDTISIFLDHPTNDPECDFAADDLYFPRVKFIEFKNVNMKSFTFTEKNTPRLEKFRILSGGNREAYEFNLSAPKLTLLELKNFKLVTKKNMTNPLGLSISRSPNLKHVRICEVQSIGEFNCILPNCEEFSIVANTDKTCCNIWYAPKLTELSFEECVGLRARCYNRPGITLELIEQLSYGKPLKPVETLLKEVKEQPSFGLPKCEVLKIEARLDAETISFFESNDRFEVEEDDEYCNCGHHHH